MDNQITNINAKIDRLRKEKAKMQTQQAICFMREAQKILRDGFTPEVALGILSSMWETASKTQKQHWKRNNFQPSVVKQSSLTSDIPTTKDELIRAYEELCEEFLRGISCRNKEDWVILRA